MLRAWSFAPFENDSVARDRQIAEENGWDFKSIIPIKNHTKKIIGIISRVYIEFLTGILIRQSRRRGIKRR